MSGQFPNDPHEHGQPDEPRPGQPPYGSPSYGQPQPGESGYVQPAYGQPTYGEPFPGQQSAGQPAYDQQFGQAQFGQAQYGQAQYGQIGQSPYGQAGLPKDAYAHWGLRVGALLLDYLLLVPFYIVIIVARLASDGAGASILVLIAYLGAIAVAIWNIIIRQGRTGQSIGKRQLNIRLVRESNGQPLGPGLTFGRQVAHILDGLPCYVGYLWPLWDAKRQTFADKIVKSVVVPTQR